MKTITVIAIAVVLGLAWSGVALPADQATDKTREVKQDAKGAGESTTDKMKAAGEKAKDKVERAWDKTKEAVKGDRTATRGDVRAAQMALRDNGFDPGPIDGVMGPRTSSAVRQYQQKEGLEATGRLDAATTAKLGVSSSSERSTASGTSPAASPATDPQKEKIQKP